MSEAAHDPGPDAQQTAAAEKAAKKKRKWRRRRRVLGVLFLLLVAAGVVVRLQLNGWVKLYVNHVLEQQKLYQGRIGSIDIDLYRGRYSINHIKLLKMTGNVSAPLFECERLDLAVDWSALLRRRVKARGFCEKPQINVVAAANDADGQTGDAAGAGPWLGILKQLSPFEINAATINEGSLHFQAPERTPMVDVYLDQLNVEVKNLTNVEDPTNPLNATVDVTGQAMNSGKLECHIKFNPFSYKPTFQLALRLLRLDVTETNAFTRAYGKFDFERGLFFLVIQLESKEGILDGYIKPLFRHLSILGPNDFRGGNILNGFWQALLGGVETILENRPRDQFGTQIPVSGIIDAPNPDILSTVFNVLRNAFIRAYLPRLEGNTPAVGELEFGPGTILDDANQTDIGGG